MAVNCSRVAVAAFMRISWNTVGPIIERVEKDLDINPNARVDDLPLGKYYLVETKTIDGFVLDDTPIEADLSYIDQNTKVVFAGMDVTNERDESNGVIYKDVCNPITAEFREELYTNILDAYARIKGLARIYFENSFIVNNINIVQGKEKIFVSMPSYKTKQMDEQGKPVYQDVGYPVTKDFREKLYNEIISEYEKAKDKSNEKARESAEKHHGNPDKEKDKEATPFR